MRVPPSIKRLITRFDNAAQDYAFRGTIPAGESEEAAEVYDAIEREYARSREVLERAISLAIEGDQP